MPVTRNGRPSSVTRSPTWTPSASAGSLQDHAVAAVQPGSLNHVGLVDRGRSGVAALGHHVRGRAVHPQHRPGHRVGAAVRGHAGGPGQG
ncbi:MAG: hypothetical protein ACRDNF_16145, partial [Streptosporangiaceae bacterium]